MECSSQHLPCSKNILLLRNIQYVLEAGCIFPSFPQHTLKSFTEILVFKYVYEYIQKALKKSQKIVFQKAWPE